MNSEHSFYTIKWNGDSVSMLDQLKLPTEEVYHTYYTYKDVAEAIRLMVIRGAPAIGIAAAMGFALAAKEFLKQNISEPKIFKEYMDEAAITLLATRPTAVNLFWAIKRMRGLLDSLFIKDNDISEIACKLEEEAIRIYEEDLAINRKIGENGSKYLADGNAILTHCNAGALATAGYGTALGVIRFANEQGKKIRVYADETRPYLQGARLTAWELQKSEIDVTLIADNMAGYLMGLGKINLVIVGADRIAQSGDTANKIGTYALSVLAKHHGIPFYIAAPISTIDPDCIDGSKIKIEERPEIEMTYVKNIQIAPNKIKVFNPAFDVTPAENINAIITEHGCIENPTRDKMKQFIEKYIKR